MSDEQGRETRDELSDETETVQVVSGGGGDDERQRRENGIVAEGIA